MSNLDERGVVDEPDARTPLDRLEWVRQNSRSARL